MNIVNYSIGLHTGPILSTHVFKDDLNEREREIEGEKNEMEKKEGSRRQSKKEGDNGSRGVGTMF